MAAPERHRCTAKAASGHRGHHPHVDLEYVGYVDETGDYFDPHARVGEGAGMKTFAIDYDGTWTTDPEAFAAFASLLRRRGHRVLLVTARVSGHGEVLRECDTHVDRVLFSGSAYKREHCEAMGERVHVWIDDMPEMIGPDVPLIGGERR